MERTLVFRMGQQLHAIPVNAIGGVVSCESLREIPGAPAGVLGLAEWRGSVLTVLDLPRYLGCRAQDEPACLIRLAPPLDHTALYLPASVQLTENSDEAVSVVDPREIVRRVETEMRESS